MVDFTVGILQNREMTVKRMYLTLLAGAVIAACTLRLLDAGVAGFSSARSVGEITGGALTLFLVGALVSTVLVVLSRKRTASAASPTALGIAALAAFSASFPGPPEVRELVMDGGIAVTQANFYGRDTILRAECLSTEGRLAPTRETVLAEMREHARRNGLMDVDLRLARSMG